jgi:non-heme chloroperoxidase
MPFIQTADRTSLFVTEWGSGPPVVFTHAWGLRSDQWNYQIPAASLTVYPGAGHGLYASDHHALNADLLAFINGEAS